MKRRRREEEESEEKEDDGIGEKEVDEKEVDGRKEEARNVKVMMMRNPFPHRVLTEVVGRTRAKVPVAKAFRTQKIAHVVVV